MPHGYVVTSHLNSIILLMQSSGKYFIHCKMLLSERLTAAASSYGWSIAAANSNDCIEGSVKNLGT
jgi:hypothetical protein